MLGHAWVEVGYRTLTHFRHCVEIKATTVGHEISIRNYLLTYLLTYLHTYTSKSKSCVSISDLFPPQMTFEPFWTSAQRLCGPSRLFVHLWVCVYLNSTTQTTVGGFQISKYKQRVSVDTVMWQLLSLLLPFMFPYIFMYLILTLKRH